MSTEEESGELKTTFEFRPKLKFSYHTSSGTQETLEFIELRAPTSRHSREGAALLQAFMRAREDIDRERAKIAALGGPVATTPTEEDVAEATKEALPGREIIMVMAISDRVDLPEVFDVGRKLFANGTAYLDGKVKMTNALLDRMNQDDFEEMLGAYLVNFTLAFLLS